MVDQERGYARIPDIRDDMEMQHLRLGYSPDEAHGPHDGSGPHPGVGSPAEQSYGYGAYSAAYGYASDRAQEFWDRLRGKGRRKIGWGESLKNILLSSCEYSSPCTR